VDLAKIWETAQKLGLNASKIFNLYRKHKSKVETVIEILGGLFGKDDGPVAPSVPVITAPPAPPEVPTAPAPPAPPAVPGIPVAAARVISSLRMRFFFIERNHKPIPKPDFDKVMEGQDPLDDGDRIHIDITPYDQFGNEVRPGSPELGQLLNADGSNRMQYDLSGDTGEITNEYDDYGCTPVLKVPRGLELGVEKSIGPFSAWFTRADGPVVAANPLPALRVKPWGN
jgi:hypothetical protein